MLLNTIKSASLEARKAKDTARATLLVTLYAEASKVGKDDGNRDTSDAEVIAVVRKFLKGIDDSLKVLKDDGAIATARFEKSVLEAYLPAQVSGDALKAVIEEIVSALPAKSPAAMGAVMKQLKDRLGTALNAGEASPLVKAALQ